ncbi:MAG: serine/threonine protein kinase [Myxococcaceae bacterium]
MLDRLGRYRLLRRIATGGMGEVFLARHEGPAGFERTVVVKRIRRRYADDERFVAMLVNEARVAAQLMHPNIVQVYELGEAEDEYFIAMEYVQGKGLHEVISAARLQGPLPLVHAAHVAWQVLQGLDYAHRARDARGQPLGVVHRDVSPDNVLLSFEGVVKLTDFGLVKSGLASNDRPGELQGKLAYLSPEQSHGGAVDVRADVYGCGALLYELLCGRPPFVESDRDALLLAVREKSPSPLRAERAEVPEILEQAVMKALAKNPDDRFASAREMAKPLETWLQSTGESLVPASLSQWLHGLFPPDALAGENETSAGTQGTQALKTQGASAMPTAVASSRRAQSWRRWWWVPLAAGAGVLGVVRLVRSPASPLGERELVVTAEAPAREAPVSAPPVVASPAPIEPLLRPTLAEPLPAERPRPRPGPRFGSLSVRVNPWANVTINGQDAGISPVGPLRLPAGDVSIVLRNPELGLERALRIRLRADQTLLLKEDLLEPKAR